MHVEISLLVWFRAHKPTKIDLYALRVRTTAIGNFGMALLNQRAYRSVVVSVQTLEYAVEKSQGLRNPIQTNQQCPQIDRGLGIPAVKLKGPAKALLGLLGPVQCRLGDSPVVPAFAGFFFAKGPSKFTECGFVISIPEQFQARCMAPFGQHRYLLFTSCQLCNRQRMPTLPIHGEGWLRSNWYALSSRAEGW